MVVAYPSGSEGSLCSFCFITPRILFWRVGSVLPFLLPQIIFTIGWGCGVVYLHKAGLFVLEDPSGVEKGFNTLGVLLSFLMVFKTQTAYNQFWEATSHVDGMLQIIRKMAMSSVTMFSNVDSLDIDQESRRMVRLLALFYFVCIEFFQRTGQNETLDADTQDRLRDDIRRLTGKREFVCLYPGDAAQTRGSESLHKTARPTVVLFWVEQTIARVLHAGAVAPPIVAAFQGQLNSLMSEFWGMNKIDKTQFPLPYAQIVKWLILIFNCCFPFVIVSGCGYFTPCVSLVAAIGFFGLDEVAEVLESPFGSDPNDIDLRRYARKLMEDLAFIYHTRNVPVESVFESEDSFDLTATKDEFLLRSVTPNSSKGAFTPHSVTTPNWLFHRRSTMRASEGETSATVRPCEQEVIQEVLG